ncbi:alginate export family protein [Spirosoma areae]
MLTYTSLLAQFTLNGQLRTRTEYRHGQGTLVPKLTQPAIFTSQRTRLNVGYTGYRYKFFTALQDVRVWGQDASTINQITSEIHNGLMVHEAWGEISLVDTGSTSTELTLKIGRQELLYDDSRLLGNLDWLQQGRRHDAAVLKWRNKDWAIHLGGAFNQNKEGKIGTIYNGVPTGYPAGSNGISTLYKSLQFLYIGREFKNGRASLLGVKDDFNKYETINNQSRVYTRGVWNRVTAGGYISAIAAKRISLTGSAYYQFGRDQDGVDLSAYLLTMYTSYQLAPKFNLGLGIDYTSGGGSEIKNRRFDPLYGTPHKFWGYMDFFYVSDGFGLRNGLVDFYLKTRYNFGDKITLTLDAHQFSIPNQIISTDNNQYNRNLGTEVDLVANYSLSKAINCESGYCTFFATPSLASKPVKNVQNAQLTANWVYLMISIKPNFLNK